MKRVIIVGATGSVGRQALDVVVRHPDAFSVAGLSAHRDEAGLVEAAVGHPGAVLCLSGGTPASSAVRYGGADGLERLIKETDADIVLNAAAGSGGIAPSFHALACGKDLALANKETIVMAGRLAFEAAAASGARILPVDSEHSAIFAMVERFGRDCVRGLIITASGGAFRDLPIGRLADVRPGDALSHPTWNMGAKITVDSASMANKGLEVIEAARLFSMKGRDIRVVLHPESRVHSFVRTIDGSLYAQLSRPDMRIPILHALSWPDMMYEDVADMNPSDIQMHFFELDESRYPMLGIAYKALDAGEGYTDAYNAANEVAVAAFMAERIRFTDIGAVVTSTLEHDFPTRLEDMDSVMDTDRTARDIAEGIIKEAR